ncbi:MAG: Asp23/Gls24 family envelope stress response protein [Anaerolineae bacterium]|nr:Asp23/Gls24 family envelope stress response protein [Anaerolineae bacterium]
MNDEQVRGRIEVLPTAVATIANHAVLNSYGVVGMSPKNLANGLAKVLRPDSKRGVEVHIDEDQIIIDLYVVIEYGVRIATVARNIMDSVKFSVEKAMGIPIAQVNVHVQGVHVSSQQ